MSDNNSDISDKLRNIEFQVDTVADTKGASAYYTPNRNAITANYKKDYKEALNNYMQSRETITHEQKHRDNYQKGMFAWPVSSEQAYKLEMHDEISAMMTEIISLRDEYIKTGDIHVFDALPKSKFYTDAIKNGEIKPGSPYQEDFDKEMRLLVNGSRKVWLENWGNDFYVKNGVSSGLCYGDHSGAYAKYHDQNYEQGKKIAYTIGGVDFTQYIDKDVEIPEKGKEALNKALKGKPDTKYQKFLASSCGFFGLEPDQTQRIVGAAQGEKGLTGKIAAPIGATLSAALIGTYNRLRNSYHEIRPPKNKQTHPVDIKNPSYREWKNEDGHRVSAVQHRQILDMNKNIIKKPTTSYTTKKSVPFASQPKSAETQVKRVPQEKSNSQNIKTQMKKDREKAKQTHQKLNMKNIQTYMTGKQAQLTQFFNKNLQKIMPSKQQSAKISDNKTQNLQNIKGKMGSDAQQAGNKYHQKMVAMIQNMNKINDPKKSIDAQETSNILYQKYGDDAYNLLLKAITEPTNYSQITGEQSIKTSREAVQHLSAMENNEKTRIIISKMLQNREK